MNKLQKKWLEALRSGGHERGKTYLKSEDNRFCCLGVLCDIVDNKAWVWDEPSYEWKGHTGALPESIRAEVGLTDAGEFKTPIEGNYSLASLNDSGNYSFAEIADIIEEKFKTGDFV